MAKTKEPKKKPPKATGIQDRAAKNAQTLQKRREFLMTSSRVEPLGLSPDKRKAWQRRQNMIPTPERAAFHSKQAGRPDLDAAYYQSKMPPAAQQPRVAAQTANRLKEGLQTETDVANRARSESEASRRQDTGIVGQKGDIAQTLQNTQNISDMEQLKEKGKQGIDVIGATSKAEESLEELRNLGAMARDDNTAQNIGTLNEQTHTYAKEMNKIHFDQQKEWQELDAQFDEMSKDADYWRGQGNRQQVADIEESQMKLLQEQRMDINTQLAGLEEIAKESSAQFADNHTKSAAELDRLYITLSSKLKKSLIENQQKQSRWDAKMQRKIGNDQAKNRQEMFGAATDAQITLSEFNRNTNIGSQGVQNEQERSMAEINARNARDFQGDQFDYKKSLPPTPDQDVARATADLAINETQIAQSLSDAGVISIDDIITSMEDVAGDIGAAGWLGMNSEKNQSNAISVMNQYNNLVNGNAGSYWRNWFDSQPQWNKFIQKINDGYLGSKQPPRAQPNVPPKANGGVFGPLKKTFSF